MKAMDMEICNLQYSWMGSSLYTQDSYFEFMIDYSSKCWFIFHEHQENQSEFSELRKENSYFSCLNSGM